LTEDKNDLPDLWDEICMTVMIPENFSRSAKGICCVASRLSIYMWATNNIPCLVDVCEGLNHPLGIVIFDYGSRKQPGFRGSSKFFIVHVDNGYFLSTLCQRRLYSVSWEMLGSPRQVLGHWVWTANA